LEINPTFPSSKISSTHLPPPRFLTRSSRAPSFQVDELLSIQSPRMNFPLDTFGS
jgi:hypothetical protein